MSENGRYLPIDELMLVLEAQTLVDSGEAEWETPWHPWNLEVWALCDHDRRNFWTNDGGRQVCNICHPPVNARHEGGALVPPRRPRLYGVTPGNPEPVESCALCRYPLGESFVETENGLRWCTDLEPCKSRAARSLGVPEPGEARQRRGDAKALEELLAILARARQDQPEWYAWVIAERDRREQSP